ncbi:hypothetical protein N9Y92_03130 [Chlamydiales bacterium]|nr:hypothetical protein [Chlamydiales bacterium]
MFESNKEIEEVYRAIREIKDTIDSHIEEKSDKPLPKEILRKLETLKEFVAIFKEINRKILEKKGITPEELEEDKKPDVIGRDPKVEALMKVGEDLKMELVYSKEKFIYTQLKDLVEKKRPFKEDSEKQKKSAKRKMKRKYNKLKQQMKWKKM